MKPDSRFLGQPKSFWAYVRTVSQEIGYTVSRQVRVPTIDEVAEALLGLGLQPNELIDSQGVVSHLGRTLLEYFAYRATVLNTHVENQLMDVLQARSEFERLRKALKPTCPIPMNKQKGKKRAPAYFTAIINMLIDDSIHGLPCDFDPRSLTSFTRNGAPLRTLARRIDGAFPSTVDPISVWEVKEYYYTTTFGSRVADGVYESLLDGMELEELRQNEDRKVLHYLFVDSRYTWWECGRSYLCRIVDMMHMGYVDEVLFGREVLTDLPNIVHDWVKRARRLKSP